MREGEVCMVCVCVVAGGVQCLSSPSRRWGREEEGGGRGDRWDDRCPPGKCSRHLDQRKVKPLLPAQGLKQQACLSLPKDHQGHYYWVITLSLFSWPLANGITTVGKGRWVGKGKEGKVVLAVVVGWRGVHKLSEWGWTQRMPLIADYKGSIFHLFQSPAP